MKKILLLILIMFLSISSTQAIEIAFQDYPESVQYGLVEGATISCEANVCSINLYNDVKGAKINWKNLNLPKGTVLKIFFAQKGQYIINRIYGDTSQIFGSIEYLDGSNTGTVIFSNPAGFVFAPSSSFKTNGSALITTHNINEENFELKLKTAADNKFHGISFLAGSRILQGENLTVASSGIYLNTAAIQSKYNIFVNAQGLKYIIDENTITNNKIKDIIPLKLCVSNVYLNTENNTSQIAKQSEKSAFQIKNSTIISSHGQTILNAMNEKDVLQIENSLFDGDVIIKTKNDLNIISGTQKNGNKIDDKSKGAFMGELEINSIGDVVLSSSSTNSTFPLFKNLFIQTQGGIKLKNVRIMEDVSQQVVLNGKNVSVENFDIANQDWSNSILGEVRVNAQNFNALQTQFLGNTKINAINGNIEFSGVLLGQNENCKTELNAENIIIKDGISGSNKGFIARVRGKLIAKAQNSISLLNNSLDFNEAPNADLESKNVEIKNFALKSLKIQNPQEVKFNLAEINGDLNINGMVNENSQMITSADFKRLKLGGNLTISNINDLTLESCSVLSDLTLNNSGNVKLEENKIQGSIFASQIYNLTMGSNSAGGTITLDAIKNYFDLDENNTYSNGSKYFFFDTGEKE